MAERGLIFLIKKNSKFKYIYTHKSVCVYTPIVKFTLKLIMKTLQYRNNLTAPKSKNI